MGKEDPSKPWRGSVRYIQSRYHFIETLDYPFSCLETLVENFAGVVSLEVFNLENLNRSLIVLSKVFKNIAPMIVNFPK